jgi:hypothetical protein
MRESCEQEGPARRHGRERKRRIEALRSEERDLGAGGNGVETRERRQRNGFSRLTNVNRICAHACAFDTVSPLILFPYTTKMRPTCNGRSTIAKFVEQTVKIVAESDASECVLGYLCCRYCSKVP